MIHSLILVFALIVSVVCFVFSLMEQDFFFSVLFLLSGGYMGYVVFSDSMNLVQRLWFFYWIIRDNGKPSDPILSSGFMRQTDSPWLTGKGVQVRLSKYVVQIGFCKENPAPSEDVGVLNAMQGRYMDNQPKEIAKWR